MQPYLSAVACCASRVSDEGVDEMRCQPPGCGRPGEAQLSPPPRGTNRHTRVLPGEAAGALWGPRTLPDDAHLHFCGDTSTPGMSPSQQSVWRFEGTVGTGHGTQWSVHGLHGQLAVIPRHGLSCDCSCWQPQRTTSVRASCLACLSTSASGLPIQTPVLVNSLFRCNVWMEMKASRLGPIRARTGVQIGVSQLAQA
jgi:hypothetical protein